MVISRFLLLSFGVLLGFAASGMADTVILKNGEKVEGRILAETDAQVTVEVKVTASIKDERVIKRAEIDKIEKAKQDEEAWVPLKALALGEDSMEPADYQAIITRLSAFVTQFPDSPRVKEAKTKIDEFQAERTRVETGEIKEKGKWLSKDQVQEERVQISGRVMLSRMRKLAATGQLIEAMNVYEALEKNFAGSYALPEAIELARQVVPQIKVAAEQQRERLLAQAAENKRRLEVAQGQEREQLATVLRNQAAATDAAVSAAEKSGLRWLPLSPSKERTLSSIANRANSEVNNLNSKQVDKMRHSMKVTETARTALEAKDFPATEKALVEAQSAWPSNEVAKRLYTKLNEARQSAQAAATAAQAKPPEPEPVKPKATPTPTPAVVAVVDDAPRVPDSPPFYTQPIFYVVLGLLGLFGVIGFIAYRKFRDPNKNLLDQ
jgi:hypothetical protein